MGTSWVQGVASKTPQVFILIKLLKHNSYLTLDFVKGDQPEGKKGPVKRTGAEGYLWSKGGKG